jgi:hypothetical protein
MSTGSPAREFVGVRLPRFARVAFPRAGHFDAVAAAIKLGLDPTKVYASDVTLDASLIGYLADPEKSVMDLGIRLEGDAASFTEGDPDEVAYAAGVMLALQWMAIPPNTLFNVSRRRSFVFDRVGLTVGVVDKLTKLLAMISGIHYEVDSPAKVLTDVCDLEDAAVYADLYGLPTQPRQLAEPDWVHPSVRDVTKPAVPGLLEALPTTDTLIMAMVDESCPTPEGWSRDFAQARTRYGKTETAYLLSNRSVEDKHAEPPVVEKPPHIYEIFDDCDEITPQSVVSFVSADKSTCLYYRDLFVHRLGSVVSDVYLLMLIDGKVVTACGLHDADLFRGRAEYLYETFGITVTSARYERLNKLYKRLLVSGETRDWLLAWRRGYVFNEPRGIQTTALSTSPESKGDRTITKLVRREPLIGGGYKLIYHGDFTDKTYAEVIPEWLKESGHHHSVPWVCIECGFGTDSYVKPGPVQTVKKKRGRGSGGRT